MAVLTVGTNGIYATISAAVAAAVAGDTIDVQAGTYLNDFPPEIGKDLTLQGIGGMVDMVATTPPPNEKGILDVGGAGVTVAINDFSFSGSAIPDDEGGNGAGIRYEGGTLLLNNDDFQDNQDGLLANPDPAGIITINHSEFADNGSGSGLTHNLYVNQLATLTVTNSYFTGAVVGHEIKSRAGTTIIENDRIQDGPDGTTSYEIDLPNGGNATVSGNVIEKGPLSENSNMISYGEEGGVYASSSLTVSDNTILDDQAAPSPVGVVNDTSVTASISDNLLYGLSAGQLVVGPANVSGTVLLATEPALDTAPPFVACFLEGTHIMTPDGERLIEALAPGDLVVTAEGGTAPVRWLGVQTILRFMTDPVITLPVRVRAGALGNGIPSRDLLVSPGHALLIDGILIHAGALVNGRTITVESRIPTVFRYYHLELPHHSVILAEGAPAESYMPWNERHPFDNAGQRPPVAEDAPPAELPYPRARAPRQIPRALAVSLARRAGRRAA